ncbi:MAG: hypothetical protein WCG26_04180 [Chloroflexales bacterium]
MECYTCLLELLPVVESALAARGFVNHQAPQREATGGFLTVMTHGDTTILLREDLKRDMGNIEVYSETAPSLTDLQELFPPILSNHSAPPPLRHRRWRVRGDR